MGVSVEQWRASIGLFANRKLTNPSNVKGASVFSTLLMRLCSAVLVILLIIGGVELNPGPFPCKLCSAVPETIASSIRHQRIHSLSRNFKFNCPVQSCLFDTTSYGSLKFHVSMFHRQFAHRNPAATESIVCLHREAENCMFSTTSLWELVQHLCKHLQENVRIECPIEGCLFSRDFKSESTFRVHLSQYHKDWKAEGCPKQRFKVSVEDYAPITEAAVADAYEDTMEEHNPTDEQLPIFEESLNSDLLNDELMYDTIAKFYLNLYAVDVLPASLIQRICHDLAFLSDVVQGRLNLLLHSELEKLGVEEDKRRNICHNLKLADPMYTTHHKAAPGPSLTSDFLRKNYFKTNFGYLPPVEVNLNEEDITSDEKYQYISPTATLTKLLEDPSIQKEIDASFVRQPEDETIISDYTSGAQFLSEDHSPRELHLFVYQDAVNIVMNALGSAKNKFKSLNMYFTLGNFRPHIRARVDTKYPVMMVRESIFKAVGPFKCFQRVIDEFKKLETEGIFYKGCEKIKVCVQYILGDNLGQHTIGGFIEAFSAQYFCRFCPITKALFREDPAHTEPRRSIEDYEECVQEARITGEHCRGVKNESPFNALKHIHATSHLVPCLAHDLFEGVVSWDLAGIIRHFVKKKKYFTYKLLNRRIKQFQCLCGDSPNKPACVLNSGKKLGGHAVQNWTLLRLLPFIIGDKIEDHEDSGWRLYLQLKELCEYFTAPSLKKTDIAYLKDVLLPLYFYRRSKVLSRKLYPLKPKHHFMSEYPRLILLYGTLLYFWTLSYEQKHKFFKQVMRMSKNFINPEKTCAVRAQLNFCCSSYELMIPEGFTEFQSKYLNMSDFESGVSQFLEGLNLEQDWRSCKGIVFNRLDYRVNDLLILSREGINVRTAFIKVIATRSNSVYFLLEVHEARKRQDEGIFYIPIRPSGRFLWKSASDLQHPVTQPVYVHNNRQCFSLKYHLP